MDLAGKSALVSGGAGGLGGASVRRLAELGVGVVVFDPDAARAEALAKEVGDKAVAVAGDQNEDADVHRAIDAAHRLGVFSINVNSAGVIIRTPRTVSPDGVPHDMDSFRTNVEMHLFGPFNVSRLCAAAFAANTPNEDGERGVIINTSSTAAWEGQLRQAAYAACKGAIRSMTGPMARDLADIGVRVNAIAPGPILTPRLAAAPEELKRELAANVAFPKRLGKGEDFGLLVEAIVRNPFLNGQTIRLDGALSTPLTEMIPKA
jgi:NAD(P)-dependent dehydrogenase (short-subunit alcohol dehydrogenase family)